jgi:hypothetical protein
MVALNAFKDIDFPIWNAKLALKIA